MQTHANGTTPPPRFGGLIAAPFATLHADGSVNLAAIDGYAQLLIANQVRGAFVCGTTGEGPSLSNEERMQTAARWRSASDDRLRLIVHVGHSSIAEARALASHAEAIGADAVAAVAPSFFRPQTLETLVECCGEIASAAPRTPFYYYHLPAMTGAFFPMRDFLALARGRIPSFAGIKFTHEDLMDYARCVDAAQGAEQIFFGRDEILLSALALGSHGAVGSTYNFAAPLFYRMVAAFEQGELAAARALQRDLREMIAVCLRYGGLPALKALMQWYGVDCGPCRRPLVTLSPAQQAQLHDEVVQLPSFGQLGALPLQQLRE